MHFEYIKHVCLTICVLYQIQSATASCKDQVCESLVDIGVNTRPDWKYIQFSHWLPIRRRYLEANTFGSMPHLTYITLTRMVNGTNRYAFNGLIRLNTVVSKDNVLLHLPDELFQNNPLMQKIVIKNCQLEDIGTGLFQNLPLLSHVNLEGNRIENIEKEMFPRSLVELILKNNQINFIGEDTFHKMKKLQNLDLSENKLHSFEIDNTLRLFPKMTVAWFAMNPLTCDCFKDMMKYTTENKVKVLYNYEEEWNNYRKCNENNR
ncbi:uncharacterized protein CBL_02359 [Carabus blaptoides fortunei]